MFHPLNQRAAKKIAKPAAQHIEEEVLTKLSSLVCKLATDVTCGPQAGLLPFAAGAAATAAAASLSSLSLSLSAV